MYRLAMLEATVISWLKSFREEDRGASLVEYALLLALIAVVAIVALVFLGHAVKNTLNNVAQNINNAG